MVQIEFYGMNDVDQKFKNYTIKIREMLGVLLVFSWCSPNCDMTFKITILCQ